jgi:hypothetical protein
MPASRGFRGTEENNHAREPIHVRRTTGISRSQAKPPHLFAPQKPTRLHPPPTCRLPPAQNLPQLDLPRLNKWLLATDQVRQVLELTRVPAHTTLARTFAKLCLPPWERLNDTLLQPLPVRERVVAADSTGFRDQSARAYYQSRCGRAVRGTKGALWSAWRGS